MWIFVAYKGRVEPYHFWSSQYHFQSINLGQCCSKQVRSSSLMQQVKLKSIKTFQVNQSISNPLKFCNVGSLLEGSVKLTFTGICCGNFCTSCQLLEARNRGFWREKGNQIDLWTCLKFGIFQIKNQSLWRHQSSVDKNHRSTSNISEDINHLPRSTSIKPQDINQV